MPKILIVDDSAFMRNQLARCLNEHGYETILACDGEQAVHVYRQARPDLVIMDIVMPKLGGLDALTQIRIFDPQAQVIMLTAMEHKSAAARAVHMGARDFLVKPIFPSKVAERVDRLLKRSANGHIR